MTEQTKLILAQMQIENISNLIKDNEYERFMNSHLISLRVEIERQLSNINHRECASLRAVH
jgi:hypothetical protein